MSPIGGRVFMNKKGFFIRPKEKEWRENVTNPLKIHLSEVESEEENKQ